MPEPTFSLDTVAVLVLALEERGATVGASHFKQMSELHGNRGEHGFNHDFRKVKQRAKEIANGRIPVAGSVSAGQLTPSKAAGKGRSKKTKKRGNEELNDPTSAGEEEKIKTEEAPAKKRATASGSAEKVADDEDAGFDYDEDLLEAGSTDW